MDRVLIVIDNIQFSSHLENTLRKVGYVTDVLQSEYNLSERVLSFNPDIIVTRGSSSRLSAVTIAKKLKDNLKYNGKLILIFNQENLPNADQLFHIKADLILNEPASAIKIALSLLNLELNPNESMKEKLFKLAADDQKYKTEEQSYLIQYGLTVEQELINVRSAQNTETDHLFFIKSKIQLEMNELKDRPEKVQAKIENYNQKIDEIDKDLKIGLSKRDTKKESKLNRKLWKINESSNASNQISDLDEARKDFTNELFKKINKINK